MKHDLATRIRKKGQGRFEELQKAVAENNLHQPGLMQAVADSVADGYPEFADFVTDTVIHLYGRAVIPFLTQPFNPNGKMEDARRLRVLRRLDPNEAKKLARLAVNAVHVDLAREAIKTLLGSKKDYPLLLQQTSRGSAQVRTAAFEALRGVTDNAVVDAVSKALSQGVVEASEAMFLTPHPAYTLTCVNGLESLEGQAGREKGLTDKQCKTLCFHFQACCGHGSSALDGVLSKWVARAVGGCFSQVPGSSWDWANTRAVLEAVAMGEVPASQRLLVEHRDFLGRTRMTQIMCAAAWHKDLDLVELFSPYLHLSKSRCRGWYCSSGGDWPCSILSAVEFALDVDIDSKDYKGRVPHPPQKQLIQRIRGDRRWRVARLG